MQFYMADAYNLVELPVALRRVFSLSKVEKRELKVTSVKNTCRRHDAHFLAVQTYADGVDAPLSPALEDNFLVPRLDPPVLSVYVDNFATIGTNAAEFTRSG